MGTFAEKAIVDYCVSFANRLKQTSVLRFHFPFPFSFCSKQMEVAFSVSPVFCILILKLQQI
jgi:hypothetical protein